MQLASEIRPDLSVPSRNCPRRVLSTGKIDPGFAFATAVAQASGCASRVLGCDWDHAATPYLSPASACGADDH